ncbi:MAG TPA: DUF4190 domain-containing protein [Verrucomicrobiales bacterium]|nr:DUF4190 domain-containing protein [Verrucomicrobiales bacterium]
MKTSGNFSCPLCGAHLAAGETASFSAGVCAACGGGFRVRSAGRQGKQRLSGKAVAGFLLGMLSLAGSILAGLPAIVLSILALRDIRRQPAELKGARLALAGAVLGCVLSGAIALVSVIALRTMQAKRTAEARAQAMPSWPEAPAGAKVLIEPRAEWRWLHPRDGVDPELEEPGFHRTFFLPGYDDSAWNRTAIGPLGFGYGDPVSVDIGLPPEGKRFGAYFRHVFTTTEELNRLLFVLVHDDGVIVYLDGEEVLRSNVSPGEIESYHLAAETVIGNEAEVTALELPIHRPVSPGEHVLAISLHNAGPDSSDLRFVGGVLYGFTE